MVSFPLATLTHAVYSLLGRRVRLYSEVEERKGEFIRPRHAPASHWMRKIAAAYLTGLL